MNAGGNAQKTCFVIAPIGEDESETRKRSDKVLKHVIRPVAKARGYEAIRADEISKPGLITTQVIERIANDDLVIADLSEWNPNVFYELAVRHALRKPLVQIIAKGERIPFDVAAMRTIELDVTDLDSVETAKGEIDRQIESLELDPESLQTPLSFTLDVQALGKSGDPEGRSLAEVVASVADLKAETQQLIRFVTESRAEASHIVYELQRRRSVDALLIDFVKRLPVGGDETLRRYGLAETSSSGAIASERGPEDRIPWSPAYGSEEGATSRSGTRRRSCLGRAIASAASRPSTRSSFPTRRPRSRSTRRATCAGSGRRSRPRRPMRHTTSIRCGIRSGPGWRRQASRCDVAGMDGAPGYRHDAAVRRLRAERP
jgi:hypothetical protein